MAASQDQASREPLLKQHRAEKPPHGSTTRPSTTMAVIMFVLRVGTILSLLVAVVLAAFSIRSRGASESPAAAKTYCYKGVQTLDDALPAAKCFRVADGVFTEVTGAVAAASASEILGEAELKRDQGGNGSADAADGYVIPGLWDGHGHLIDYGEMLVQVDLFDIDSIDGVRTALKDYIRAHPESGTKERWLRGIGWDQTNFGRMPTAVSPPL